MQVDTQQVNTKGLSDYKISRGKAYLNDIDRTTTNFFNSSYSTLDLFPDTNHVASCRRFVRTVCGEDPDFVVEIRSRLLLAGESLPEGRLHIFSNVQK